MTFYFILKTLEYKKSVLLSLIFNNVFMIAYDKKKKRVGNFKEKHLYLLI